ncbi:Uncharacterized conserved protein YlxW, UPF0749 family [Salinibacillus kushneri]|uniref:Uncharacterized conserved protein YlxW, UPF0749 family n=1 Tax=Salinibacillus kushneri TaxID=237682 RepID=A0A1I0HMY0_9BACI|nr:DUF881 domain-containing protein [Salinibacillus kushneri]SET85339.1 Uncharacterized conserved protein YlxW, UPF0749 family [Salinibacillus kushneri]
MGLKGKHVIFSFILLVAGFLLAFGYKLANENGKIVSMNEEELQEELQYQEQLNDIEQENKELRSELESLRNEIRDFEEKLGSQEEQVNTYIEDRNRLEVLTGDVPVEGPGITVTLKDAEYIPNEDNVNDYIVHDLHVHLVINELLASGANAISINGQRILKDSYITCTGPVITVDGKKHPAPFVIQAIGDSEVLEASMALQNGVLDRLVSDHVEVNIESNDNISMDAVVSSEGW